MKQKLPPIKPYFHRLKPLNTIEVLTPIKKEEMNDGQVLEETDSTRKVLEVELNYDSCYYEGDSPSIRCEIVTYQKEVKENPEYEKQLAVYKREHEEYKKALAKYKVKKEEYDKQTALENEEWEKNLLEKLKEKYEKK